MQDGEGVVWRKEGVGWKRCKIEKVLYGEGAGWRK